MHVNQEHREKYYKFMENNPNHGLSDYKVSEKLGISRPNIQRWRKQYFSNSSKMMKRKEILEASALKRYGDPNNMDVTKLPSDSYAYILGMYLGDGCLSKSTKCRTCTLYITQNREYDIVVNDCLNHLKNLMKEFDIEPTVVYRKNSKACDIKINSVYTLKLFPQHGEGLKHDRKINLEDWQWTHVEKEPWMFIKGLMHSDGSKYFDKYNSKWHWQFTNRSEDIKDILCQVCDTVGLQWTRCKQNVSFYKSESVIMLNENVGEKISSYIGRDEKDGP